MSGSVVRAIRGAVTVDADNAEEVRAATTELLREVLLRNALEANDLISILFTATPDLVSEFPAVAAREIGLSHVPLMCAQEIAVDGAMARCIRVLVHCNAPIHRAIRHVYLRGARQLRLDLPE
jgi:chorismate mutase